MSSVSIDHIAVYFPEETVSNEQLALRFNTNAERIYKNTGIVKRYTAGKGEIPSDMAFKAAEILFRDKQVNRSEIDFLIFCTEGFDHKGPSTSCLLQHRLNLGNHIGCIDLPYGCSGYVYGVGIAKALLESGMAKKVLFLTADIPTKVSHKNDLELHSIFSDIGTASVITRAESKQHFVFGTDGSGYNNLIVDQSATRNPQIEGNFLEGLPYGHMKMNSTEIFLFAVKRVPQLVNEVLEKYKLGVNDVDLFVFHQASYFMLEVIRKKSKIPKEKFVISIENYGNSVSSSIPVALHDAEQRGVLKRGMRVMLAGFGIGYSWGGTIINY